MSTRLGRAYSQWRRDVAMVVGTFRGRRAPVVLRAREHDARERAADVLEAPRASRTRAAREEGGAEIAVLAVRAAERTFRTALRPGLTLLEAGLASGAPMPSSCRVGGCGACRVRLVRGHVEMTEPNCLDEDERAEGIVLACVSRPLGACEVHLLDADVPDARLASVERVTKGVET